MPRIDTLQATVYERIIARLQLALGLNNATCYETLVPEAPGNHPPGGHYFLTVSPGQGSYNAEHQFGGGEQQLTEEHTVQVTIYTRVRLDQAGHDQQALREANRGLWVIKRDVLAALVGHDLATEEGDTFLRELIQATYCQAPQHDPEKHVAWMGIGFLVSWDWDLS